MAISISNQRIVGATYKESPNHGAAFEASFPDALIIHFTAGANASSAAEWLCSPQAKASAHVVIGRDGAITQLVPFDTVAWHAGASSYGGRSGYNRYSIGIELDNPGRLNRTQGSGFVSYLGTAYPADQVVTAVHRNEQAPSDWLAYTEVQLNTAFELCALLCTTYPIREILGHEEIAPGRKVDPGPAFPLDKLRQRLIVRGRDSNEPFVQERPAATSAVVTSVPPRGFVIANQLNFRALPRIDAQKLAAPLTRGTLLDVLAQQSGWYQVRCSGNVGWVKAEYVKTAASM